MLSIEEFTSFFSKVELGPGYACWPWRGKISSYGYGRWRERFAHRVSYEHLVGPIPEGHQLHHICESRSCVNPAHLTPVTYATHPGNGPDVNRRKTHCKRGHSFTIENTYFDPAGGRRCRICRNAAAQRLRERRRAST